MSKKRQSSKDKKHWKNHGAWDDYFRSVEQRRLKPIPVKLKFPVDKIGALFHCR